MPTRSEVVCADCFIEMEVVTCGDIVEELQDDGESYKIWSADRFKCKQCQHEVVTRFARAPIVEHYQPGYAAMLARVTLSFGRKFGRRRDVEGA